MKERKTNIVFGKLNISNAEDFFIDYFFSTVKFINTRGKLNPNNFGIFCIFSLAIYGNDGDTISKRGVIINIKTYRWERVPENLFVGN